MSAATTAVLNDLQRDDSLTASATIRVPDSLAELDQWVVWRYEQRDGGKPTKVSYKDVSEVAIRCLGRDGGKVELALDGPEDLSQLDVVHLFETALGRTFAVTHVSADALQAEYDKAPDPVTRARAALKIEYARGCPADGHLSRKRIPLELTSLRNYVSTLTHAAPANWA